MHLVTNAWSAEAETFASPSPSCNALLDCQFELAGAKLSGIGTVQRIPVGSGGPVGGASYSATFSWGPAVYDITGINRGLTVGQLYGAEVDFLGYSGQRIYFQNNQTGYPGFADWWWNPASRGWNQITTLNTFFQADFGSSTPEPGSILLFATGALGTLGMLGRRLHLYRFVVMVLR